MPLYEYRCGDCGEVFEVLVGVSPSGDTVECPHCGGSNMEKLMSAAWTPAKMTGRQPGKTCCGADERCDTPPCSSGGSCRRN